MAQATKKHRNWIAWFEPFIAQQGFGGTEMAAIDNLAINYPNHFHECAYVNPLKLKTKIGQIKKRTEL
jgi:hypothetical protein